LSVRLGAAHRLPLVAVLAASCLTACGEDDTGFVEGWLRVPGCVADDCDTPVEATPTLAGCNAFSLDADFFAYDRHADQVFIRVQHRGRHADESDLLVIQVRDLDVIDLGVEIPVGVDSTVRMGLSLAQRCDRADSSLELSGRIRFDRLDRHEGGRVEASFDQVMVRDARGGTVVGELRGAIDMKIRSGGVYQRFQ
jgi:hypothetical protein